MDNPDLPQGHSPGHGDDSNPSDTGFTGRSRLEKVLMKGSLWKKQTLRNVERTQELEGREAKNREHDTDKMARMFVRLSAQLDERNNEIEQLRQAISSLENEKSQLDRSHQRELELHRAELERLQDAYGASSRRNRTACSPNWMSRMSASSTNAATRTVDRYLRIKGAALAVYET